MSRTRRRRRRRRRKIKERRSGREEGGCIARTFPEVSYCEGCRIGRACEQVARIMGRSVAVRAKISDRASDFEFESVEASAVTGTKLR